jgi:cyclopropane fatty-acyl-phospholipid synthase-like methyltransferase
MNENPNTIEPQYQAETDQFREKGPVLMGPKASRAYRTDPRLLLFRAARYKICSKLLSGRSSVLEIGCGEGFGSPIVLQEIERLHGVDIDPVFIAWANEEAQREGHAATFSVLDMAKEAPTDRYDAAYSLDVIEHIPAEFEHAFMENICTALDPRGVCIIGTPNVTSRAFASRESNHGHVNLKGADELRLLMDKYFWNTFLFSMNDELVHLGFYPMTHYLVAMGVGVRSSV